MSLQSESEKKLLQHASYLFDKDKIEDVSRIVNLLPRGRQFVVFNVFTDIARIFGYGRRKKRNKVVFPQEVIEQYEQKGDVAGKGRFVPMAKQPYRIASASSKKRKLSAVYSSWTVKSEQFLPRVERIEDYSKLEHFCERNIISCDCCDCSCLCGESKRPSLTNVMEGYFTDLNVASLFLHSHAARTFESAMGALEFEKLHAFSLTTMTAATQKGSMSYTKQRLSILSSSIWIFGYCIRTMVQLAGNGSLNNTDQIPSEAGLKKAVELYASVSLSVMDSVTTILQYSHNFHNFCKECIRILKILQIHLGFHAEFRLKKPLKRGDGLELNRSMKKNEVVKQKSVSVLVARAPTSAPADENEEESLDWKPFTELSGVDKIISLRQLLHVTIEGVNLIQTQLRFLLDDIVDSVKDITEADLLFILADMYDRVKYLQNQRKKYAKTELAQLANLMSDFCKDFQAFVDFGQHILKRFVEFRDMIHITHEFLVNGLKLDFVSEMLPAYAFKKRRLMPCCARGKNRKGSVSKHMPTYHPIDFFRVHYMDILHHQIFANKFYFNVILNETEIKEVIPKMVQYRWDETEGGSPKLSFDEYIEAVEATEMEDESTAVEVIKPILVATAPASASIAATPILSPRGSNEDTAPPAEPQQTAPPEEKQDGEGDK